MKVTDDQSMAGVYKYPDSVVVVMSATNMLIMSEALEIDCKSLIKTKIKLAWLRLWSLFGVSVLGP